MFSLAKAYISKRALQHNIQVIRKVCHKTPICAMVKANAYGHGIKEVFLSLKEQAINFWGVASPEESIELKELGAKGKILLLRPVAPLIEVPRFRKELELLVYHNIRLTIASKEGLDFLEQAISTGLNKKPIIHLKVDTGMGRNGCRIEEAEEVIRRIYSNKQLIFEGIYSHFATADEKSLSFAKKQLDTFLSLLKKLEAMKINVPLKHIANSGAIFNIPSAHLDMVRPGIAIYGYANSNIKGSSALEPTMRIEVPILITKWLKKGESCGYGRTFVAKKPTRIALLPVGYADGIDRRLSNEGFVSFDERRITKIVGRVSMDLTAIDITAFPDIGTGSSVVIISNDRKMPNSVEAVAKRLNTIPYEISCAIGNRVQRILVD